MSAPRQAFTLVEMLLVVAIISLLIAILLPSVQIARDESRAASCAGRHSVWGAGFVQYRTDHRYLPLFANTYDITGSVPMETATLWYNATAPYVGLERVDPETPASTKSAINNRNYNAEVRRCPADASVFLGVHYGGFNSIKPAYAPINYGRNVGPESIVLRSRHSDRNPAAWMMLCDTNAHYIYTPTAWTRTVDVDLDGTPDSHPGVLGVEGSVHYYNRGRPTVHRGSGPYAFVDGHVERVSFADWLDINHKMWTGR